MAALQSYIGAVLSIAANKAPATEDVAGYTATGITYVPIGKVVSIGALGDTHNNIELELLGEGRVQRVIGVADGGAVEIVLAADKDNAGQTALAAQNGLNVISSFRLVDPAPSGETRYFQAYVSSLRDNERTTAAYKGKTASLLVNSKVVTVAAA